MNEAKKKKKKIDPKQGQLNLNPEKPSEDDGPNERHEIITCYNSGNAIWQLVEWDGVHEKEIEIYEGLIGNVLHFAWDRWRHSAAAALSPAQQPQQQKGSSYPVDFPDKIGTKPEEKIYNKFLNFGFAWDDTGKEFVKKYDVDQPFLWVLVKLVDGNYFVSYPQKLNGKTIHKEFTSNDPYYVLNTIRKVEKADFSWIVTNDEVALLTKDAHYENAPSEWKQFQPYAPVLNPNNKFPEGWIDAELKNYGFTWSDASMMYWAKDPGDMNNWQAIRFDKNGIIVFFYKKGWEQRYFCTKDFNEVQHKIETLSLDTSDASPENLPFNPANYPKAPDWDKNFSQPGQPMMLKDIDHKMVEKAGFQFHDQTGVYVNSKTKDQFKLDTNGFVWYKLDGVGEGTDNDIGHFFSILKGQYGILAANGSEVSGHDVVEFTNRLELLGFQKADLESGVGDELVYNRNPSGTNTKMKVSEQVIIWPNHIMRFSLIHIPNGAILGSADFHSVLKGIQTLETSGPGGFPLMLGHELNTAMEAKEFSWDDKRHQYVSKNPWDGHTCKIIFFGDGVAWAFLVDDYGTENEATLKDKMFDHFYNAIAWAGGKKWDAPESGAVDKNAKPVSKEEADKVMTELGFHSTGQSFVHYLYKNSPKNKGVEVNSTNGRVRYNFQYVENPVTGELKWGHTIFTTWDEWIQFIGGKIKKVPVNGKLPYTPNPSDENEPVVPQQMPWSGFDYEEWGKGSEHNPNGTIGLVPDDDKTMNAMGFIQQQENQAIVYKNVSSGETVYFFVDGHALIHKPGEGPHNYSNVKAAMNHLWAVMMHTGTPAIPDNYQGDPDNLTQEDYVIAKMEGDFGFTTSNKGAPGAQYSVVKFVKKEKKWIYDAVFHPEQKMMEFFKSTSSLTANGHHQIVEQWTLPIIEAFDKFEEMFGKPDHVAPKGKKKKKVLAGTEDMPWSGTDYLQWGNTVLKAMGTGKGMSLHPTEVETLKKLGWNETGNSKVGYSYENGNQKMVFHPSGFTEYWSNFGTNPTQTWNSVEMAIRWLWKNNKPATNDPTTGIMPWSGTDYKEWMDKYLPDIPEGFSISLKPEDTNTMASIGFVKKVEKDKDNTEHTFYTYEKTGIAVASFYKGDVGYVWDLKKKVEGQPNPPIYAGNIYKAMKYCWDHFKNVNPTPKKAETDDMPWSGHDYNWSDMAKDQGKDPVHTTITLLPTEEKTLTSMGFNRLENAGVKWYEKAGTNQFVEFFADGHASIVDKSTSAEVEYFDTIKECLEFLWKKYHPGPTKKTNGDVPYSDTDYVEVFKNYANDKEATFELVNDEDTLEKMGFSLKDDSKPNHPEAYYFNSKTQEQVYFFSDAHALVLPKLGDGKPITFNTVKECLQYLWDKYAPVPQKKAATGDMPWYGNVYEKPNSDNTPIKLKPEDAGTMESIGFKEHMVPSNIGNALYFYQNDKGDRFYFRRNGESEYADPSNNAKKFATVKDAMQFGWDKFAEFI